jgi:hypothetical protein
VAAAVDHELARRAPATGLTVGNATAQFRPSWRSDPRNDLDPRRMHQREPLSLLLGILVRDGADEVVAPAACRSCSGVARRVDQLDLFEPDKLI